MIENIHFKKLIEVKPLFEEGSVKVTLEFAPDKKQSIIKKTIYNPTEEMLIREENFRNLDHTNIVKCFGFEKLKTRTSTKQGDLLIYMEYMNKGTMQQMLNLNKQQQLANKPFSGNLLEKLGSYILLQVIKGLAYLQKKMIAHRDIKPSNICINSQGEVKIIDFGTSAQNSDNYQYKETFIGTTKYLAPEIWLEGKYVSEKSDVFALGVSIFKFLFGKHPFLTPDLNSENLIEDTYMELMENKIKADIPDWLSCQFKDVLANMLEIKCKKRKSPKSLLKGSFFKNLLKEEMQLQVLMKKFAQQYLKSKEKIIIDDII